MTGYLARLAQRALNQAPVVHADANLPFVAAPEPLPAAQTMFADDEAEPAAGPTGSLHARAALAVSRQEEQAPERDTKARESIASTTPAAPPAEDVAANVESAPARSSEAAHDEDALHGVRVTPRARIAERPVAASERTIARTPPAPRPITRIRVDPLPETAMWAVAPLPRERPVSAREAAIPDVHIHIGRIELTALPETTPARRPSKTAKSPMSLDDYLGRRGGNAK